MSTLAPLPRRTSCRWLGDNTNVNVNVYNPDHYDPRSRDRTGDSAKDYHKDANIYDPQRHTSNLLSEDAASVDGDQMNQVVEAVKESIKQSASAQSP